MKIAFLTVLLAAGAWSQPQEQTRVFAFANGANPQRMQEVLNIVRSMAEVRQAAMDVPGRALHVTGTADQIALTTWLFTDLDKPVGPPPRSLVVRENTFSDPRSPVVRIYYPAHLSTPVQFQELVNMMRSVSEAQRVVVLHEAGAVVMRGSEEQVALAEWLLRNIDEAASGAAVPALRQYTYPDSALGLPERRTTAVRIYHPSAIVTPLALQETINGVRSIADIQRAIAFTSPRAIVIRGTTDQVAVADWLVHELDQATPAASHEYRIPGSPDGVVRSFFLAKNTSAADLMGTLARIRQTTGIQRAVAYSQQRALLLRGTPEQIGGAETALR